MVFGLSFHLAFYAQDSLYLDQFDSPYSLSIRGKVLGGGVLEDFKNLNYTIGIEQRFLKNHAVGVDYVFMRGRAEYESYDSVMQTYADNGYSDFDRRQYLLIDYRYYFNHFKRPCRWLPYANILTKLGKREMWYQYRSIFKRQADYFHISNFQEVGLAVGTHISFNYDRLVFDASLGVLRSFAAIEYEDLSFNSQINEFGLNPLRPWKMHARVNLSWYLFRL